MGAAVLVTITYTIKSTQDCTPAESQGWIQDKYTQLSKLSCVGLNDDSKKSM